MRIISDLPKHDLTPALTERWYDRHSRCWVVTTNSIDGFQIGEATYVHSKREAIADQQRREQEIAR